MGPEEIIKNYNGMLDKNTADRLATNNKRLNVDELSKLSIPIGSILDVEDYVLRLFNKRPFKTQTKESFVRHGLLGNDTVFIRLVLWDDNANLVDTIPIERGDRVFIKGLRLKNGSKGVELHTTNKTSIYRIMPQKQSFINDFSSLQESKGIDIVGKITEISKPKYFNDQNKSRTVVDSKLTDGKNEIKLVLWDSSALSTSYMNVGDIIKIEFANIKRVGDQLEIHATDKSRVIIKYNTKV